MKKTTIADVDSYIKQFPVPVQQLLQQLRNTIRKAAPNAEEIISYQMPAYKQDGMVAYFAAYANHIGFYPTASPIVYFQKEIALYKNSKGAVQFPLDQPLPLALVKKMVLFKLKENKAKAAVKSVAKKSIVKIKK
ncbi:MAG: DUF1801 domain-containing protein [Bacteroidetes bacterium]|nr:DUF1801 domain-containing protein [Bacteroidota bacterium]